MTGTRTVAETSLPGLRLARRGKVRDVYEVDDSHLLIVATDRISAFDCILPTQIERKGEVLTALSRFWFGRLASIVPNHLVATEVERMPEALHASADILRGRSMLVRRTEVFPSSASCAATLPARAGRNTLPPARSADTACPKACASRTNCPSQSSRPRRRPKRGTTKTSARRA